ncbi:3-oxoacyl-ACP synthase [Carbonactinospora thermoautotrophica]|uniref:Beta-ketoacyl-[acyl-carrier-protein] synthase III n=1 Tax=Carbonactinospora thermoautotrophica TaxID=1469144 RepID=A0A132MVK2_9ACTN|nr:beta-ketoacyl-ACP synthase III [Carbonactinospora thermoautotrophica]KWX00156.1 3-oxoacyl-ACP synthase [Carbonactinospora thermoautotrophica]KWX01863.1 3-oxoacyl-(acyl-carrier-protein) synthase [Carbonactinospora thermoautotrophica]KWX09958.1 3-oxoacyl-ACP synthase [Carbonactinospora thermoautotrophica]
MTASIRPAVGAPYARIHGVGGYRPRRLVTNEEICQRIDSSDEWIRTRSGIVTRRHASPDETVADMATAAAGKALANAGVPPEEVGCVLVSTVSHLRQTPSVACDIAYRLGATRAAAFDISAACAGFCYGLALANDMVRGGSAKYVVVIGVERLTDLTDFSDRTTAFLFGDGAGAAVVGPSDFPGIGPVVWGSDGAQLDAIEQTVPWDELRMDAESRRVRADASYPALRMSGQQVFRWASYEMVPVARKAMELAGVRPEELDAFIPHQANMRITDAMIRALKLPAHVPVARDIAEQGNTSAASIPLAMERMLETGEAKSGGTALLIGFGAGLVYAAQVVTLP